MAIVLASKSPRRRQLMQLVAPGFEVDVAGVDEGAVRAQSAVALAEALACAKAEKVAVQRPNDVVIGCDTVVEVGGRVLGKPATQAEAREMLSLLAGTRHLVHTGVCITLPGGSMQHFVETSAVDFTPIPAHEIVAYAQTDEPYDKAGGYGIQGWAARYIARIEGCFYNVMGLPVSALYHRLLALEVL